LKFFFIYIFLKAQNHLPFSPSESQASFDALASSPAPVALNYPFIKEYQ